MTDLTIASPVINNPQPTTPVIINPTPTPSIPANKLVIVAAGVSDVGAGKVKFTITNNGSGSVMIKNFYISSTIAAYKGEVASESERISTYSTGTVTLYKGDTASESERISASNVSATGTGLITVDGQATKLEILAGQTVTVLADFDGTTTGDLNIIHASINDVAYFEKV